MADRPKDSVLKIEHRSTGCFHSSTSYFEFRGDTVQIWEVVAQPGEDKPPKKVNLGIMKLSARDIEGLELLFDYYQGGPDGGCTTQEAINMTLEKDGKVVTKEKHVDGSCAAEDVEGVLTLWELVQRAKEAVDA